MNNFRLLNASAIGATWSVIVTTVLTLWGEYSPALKGVLKDFSGHHWVTKSIIAVVLYFVVMFIYYKKKGSVTSERTRTNLTRLIWVTIVGTLVIFLFFVGHYHGTF